MRRLSTVLVIALFLIPLAARPSLTQQPAANAGQRDAQALTVLSQVLKAAGGQAALAAVQDFTAKGNVTYSWGQGVQGSAIVKGRGLHQFRVDATLPDGLHSWIVNDNSTFQRKPDGSVSRLPSQNSLKPASMTFPLILLLTVVQDTSFNITYRGLITRSGQQLHDILVQKTFPSGVDPVGALGRITKADIFIDPNALTVQTLEDAAYRKDGGPGEYSRQVEFSNYHITNGILVPFSITESVAGQQTTTIQLTQITFNTGLTDNDFE